MVSRCSRQGSLRDVRAEEQVRGRGKEGKGGGRIIREEGLPLPILETEGRTTRG